MLAPTRRAQDRSDAAALYYGIAARLALRFGHVRAAAGHALAQADLLAGSGRPREALDTLTEIFPSIDQMARRRWNNDPALVQIHAKLVTEQARMLTHARDVGAAQRLLKKETDRCSSPLNRRALSTLYTTLA